MGGLISRTKTSNTQLPPKEEVTEDVPVLKQSLDFAWVTLATNDSYSLGALVLAHSLRIAGTAHKLVVLITPVVSSSMREQLANVFDVVKVVDVLDSEDEAHLALLKRPELGVTFTKIHCWRLTEYQKCVFLDADTLVLKNCDELFEREELSAAPDVGWPDCFNTGVFVYKPSIETFNELIRFSMEQGSFDGGDQGLLNQFFSDWATKDISKHLPFLYNLTSMAVYSYIPAFKHYQSQIRIVHFIGSGKPWLQYMDPSTKTVRPAPGAEHLTSLLQMWWDIFCEKVHPSLTKNLECARGMSNRETEACVNSNSVEPNNKETVSSTLRKPFTPYIDRDDSRQINLPYHPFDVKSSSGELLNITFLAEREQEMLRENGGGNEFSDAEFSAGKSRSSEAEESLKSDPGPSEKPIPEETERDSRPKRNSVCREEERVSSAETEAANSEDKARGNSEDARPKEGEEGKRQEEGTRQQGEPEAETREEEAARAEESPFRHNAFFPNETCVHNYLEQNVSIYKPLGNAKESGDASNVKTGGVGNSKAEEHPPRSLPRFLTIAENDKRQSLNVHKANFRSQPPKPPKCEEAAPATEGNQSSVVDEERIRKALSQENLSFSSRSASPGRELHKSKSLSHLEANSSSAEQVSFWVSHPDLNSDTTNRKYSMPKLKPLLPKETNKSSPRRSDRARPKITQYTEFHMSSDYKDVFDESYDKLGFVERQILEQATGFRNGRFFAFPYLPPQGTPKGANEKDSKPIEQSSVHDLDDLSSCQRQKGNQPLSDITQANNSRTENACFLPVLRPLRPGKNENASERPKPKRKSAKERGTKAKVESRKAREKAKAQIEAKTKMSSSNNVEEVLERLFSFSKDYQGYFRDFASENQEAGKGKVAAIRPGMCKKANGLENGHRGSNYSVRVYESPRLQYDKEFESVDAYFEDFRSKKMSDKRIVANGEANGKDRCGSRQHGGFYHCEGYQRERDQESMGVAAGGLPFRLSFAQRLEDRNSEMAAENEDLRAGKSSPAESVDANEKNFIEREGLMGTSKKRGEGGDRTGNESAERAAEGADGSEHFPGADNREAEAVSRTSREAGEKATEEETDPAPGQEAKAKGEIRRKRSAPEAQVNAPDGAGDCPFGEVAQSSRRAERGRGAMEAIGGSVQVASGTWKPEGETATPEAEKRQTETPERKGKQARGDTDGRGKAEGEKRAKSRTVSELPAGEKNSSGETLAAAAHEKPPSSTRVAASFRSPKLTPHPEGKTARDSRKVADLASPEDFSRNNSGIAGAIAKLSLQPGGLTGAESEAASATQEDYIRRQNWEMGTMDYMGRDSFDNIWSKIRETLDGKISKDASLDVVTNSRHLEASKPATSKDGLGGVGVGVSEGIKESGMNESSQKDVANERCDVRSAEESVNVTVPVDKASTNANKEQSECDGRVLKDIAGEFESNVSGTIRSSPPGKEERPDMSSALPTDVAAPESVGRLSASGPVALMPSAKTAADDSDEKGSESGVRELENKVGGSGAESSGCAGGAPPGCDVRKANAAVETVADDGAAKRRDSDSSGAPRGDSRTNHGVSDVTIQSPEPVERGSSADEASADTVKKDTVKRHDFVASEELIYVAPAAEDNAERGPDSGSPDAPSREVLNPGGGAQQAQDCSASEPSSDTGQGVEAEAKTVDDPSSCGDPQKTESAEVNRQRKGVLNKLLELVGVGAPTKNGKTKSEKSKSVFYDVESGHGGDQSKEDCFCKSVFYDTEASTRVQADEGESERKAAESDAEPSEEQSDANESAGSGRNDEDRFGDIRGSSATADTTADARDSEKEKDSASCEAPFQVGLQSKERRSSSDPNVKGDSSSAESERGAKSGSLFEIWKPDTGSKAQPPLEKGNGIHDAGAPEKHVELGEHLSPDEGKDTATPEERKQLDVESVKTKIDDIIDEAKKIVRQLQEGASGAEDGQLCKGCASETENEQFPVSGGSPEVPVKIFHSDEAEGDPGLRTNAETASKEDRKEAGEERKRPRSEEVASREKEALQAFGKVFVSGPVLIKPPDVAGPDSPDANADRAPESGPRDSRSETDAVHRIFREADRGRVEGAPPGEEREKPPEEEPIYCNIEEVEEIRVTSEEDRKNRKPQSSKLTEQILKAIPPPRRKPFSDARAEASAASPEAPQMLASIPAQSVSILLDRPITEEMVVAGAGEEEASPPAAPPVPPRRTRSKGRQPPLPPPKKKKK